MTDRLDPHTLRAVRDEMHRWRGANAREGVWTSGQMLGHVIDWLDAKRTEAEAPPEIRTTTPEPPQWECACGLLQRDTTCARCGRERAWTYAPPETGNAADKAYWQSECAKAHNEAVALKAEVQRLTASVREWRAEAESARESARTEMALRGELQHVVDCISPFHKGDRMKILALLLLAATLALSGPPDCPEDGNSAYFTGKTRVNSAGRLMYQYKCAGRGHLFWAPAPD